MAEIKFIKTKLNQAMNKPARLLMVSTVSSTLKVFLKPFAVYFRKLGWQVDGMANPDKYGGIPDGFDHYFEICWSRNPLNRNNYLKAAKRVKQVVKDGNYDFVHVHTPVAAFITRFALRSLRKAGKPKIIYTAHGFHFHENGSILNNILYRNLEKLAGKWTDYLVVINDEDEKAALHHRIVPPDRVRHIPGIGVDTKFFNPDQVNSNDLASIHKEFGLNSTDQLLLMIAEFNRSKGHQDAIRALAKLNRPDIHLVLAGDGSRIHEMEKLAARLSVKRQVHFAGFRNDTRTLIRASTATLLPSEREGLPMVVMESLSMGVPVIGSNIRGTRELLEDGSGILCKTGDIEKLAAAMQWIVNHPEERREMGILGRKKIRMYDVENIIKLHENMYAEVLSSKRNL
ncbi:MAG: glycosyltransferase family 4 protein [Balneolaceae bacterium]